MVSIEKIASMNPWWSKGSDFAGLDSDLLAYNSERSVIKFERLPSFYSVLKPGMIYLLKGPRRVGKTLLLKLLIKKLLDENVQQEDIFYFSFDTITTSKELDNMLRDFLSKPPAGIKYIMLDEVQSVNGWENVVKALYDAGMLANAVTIATGSIAHLLKQEMLPGRGIEGNTYLLRPLGFRDFVFGLINQAMLESSKELVKSGITTIIVPGGKRFDTRKAVSERGINEFLEKLIGYGFTEDELLSFSKRLEENALTLEDSLDSIYGKVQSLVPYSLPLFRLFAIYLRTGGYPLSINNYLYNVLHLNNQTIDENLYEELYNYVKQDAAIIGGRAAGDPAKAARIIEEAVKKIGIAASASSIANSIGMNTATVINYFERIENSYAFSSIYALDRSLNEMRKRKVYFSDIFLHYSCGSAMQGTNGYAYTRSLLDSSLIGAVVEEAILSHLIKTKEKDPMRHYRTFVNFYNDSYEADFLYKKEDGSIIAIESKYRNAVQASKIRKINGVEEHIVLSKDTLESTKGVAAMPAALFLALLKKSSSNI